MSQPWQAPEAMRLSVGGMASRDNIQHALKQIARALRSTPVGAPAVGYALTTAGRNALALRRYGHLELAF